MHRGPGFRRDGALSPDGPFGRKRQNVLVGLVLDGFDRARMAGAEARVADDVFVLPVRARPAVSLVLLGPGRRRTSDLARVRQSHLEWDVRVRTSPAPRART
jgi:hypothetical protein